MSQETVLRVEDLAYQQGRLWLIKGITFDLAPGFTALIGPNGAGKSTLMRTIAGLLHAARGRLFLGTTRDTRLIARRIGYIPQFPGAYDNLSPLEFLVRTAWWDQSGGRHLFQRAEAVLERLGLLDVKQQPGRLLHPSERRRLALASVWMRRVRVVLLDEPTAGLDPEQRLAFWQELYLLDSLPESPESYLITTHLLSEVESYCDAVLLLDRGRVRYDGSVRDFIATAHGHAFVAPGRFPAVPHIDTGRFSDTGVWVLAAAPGEGLIPRTPDLTDAYLWALNRHHLDNAREEANP